MKNEDEQQGEHDYGTFVSNILPGPNENVGQTEFAISPLDPHRVFEEWRRLSALRGFNYATWEKSEPDHKVAFILCDLIDQETRKLRALVEHERKVSDKAIARVMELNDEIFTLKNELRLAEKKK